MSKILTLSLALGLAVSLSAAAASDPVSAAAAPAKAAPKAAAKPAKKGGKALSPQALVEAGLPEGAPRKLSDLYKFFAQTTSEALGAQVKAWPVRVTGRSWELMRDAKFPEVEFTLMPFEAQGLKFEKADFLFRKLEIDRDALLEWKLKLKDVKEVQSRLVFTLRSLQRRLGEAAGAEIKAQADSEEQQVVLTGPGRFSGVPCQVEARCQFVWDETAKTLRLQAVQQLFGGHKVPKWLWWMGRSPVPETPVLDLGKAWIPFNIQEIHVGWDQVNISTNW